MSKKTTTSGDIDSDVSIPAPVKSSAASIAWAITVGVLFGAAIGAVVGVSLRPKKELTELSHEWLEEFRDVTDRVTGQVRKQMREFISKKSEPSDGYEEYSEPYV